MRFTSTTLSASSFEWIFFAATFTECFNTNGSSRLILTHLICIEILIQIVNLKYKFIVYFTFLSSSGNSDSLSCYLQYYSSHTYTTYVNFWYWAECWAYSLSDVFEVQYTGNSSYFCYSNFVWYTTSLLSLYITKIHTDIALRWHM